MQPDKLSIGTEHIHKSNDVKSSLESPQCIVSFPDSTRPVGKVGRSQGGSGNVQYLDLYRWDGVWLRWGG